MVKRLLSRGKYGLSTRRGVPHVPEPQFIDALAVGNRKVICRVCVFRKPSTGGHVGGLTTFVILVCRGWGIPSDLQRTIQKGCVWYIWSVTDFVHDLAGLTGAIARRSASRIIVSHPPSLAALYIQRSSRPCTSSIPMSPSPLLPLPDTQVDNPGSPFPLSPLFLSSPQPSQVTPSRVQNPQADSFWDETYLSSPNIFLSKSELEVVPPHFPVGGEVVDNPSVSTDHCFKRTFVDPYSYQVYDPHTPSTVDLFSSYYPATSEFDDGFASLSNSPVVLTPVSARFIWSMSTWVYLQSSVGHLVNLHLWMWWWSLHSSAAVSSS